MSGHSQPVTNAALRWGVWILSLGRIDIEDLAQTMLIPHDMDPFWLGDEPSSSSSGTIAQTSSGATANLSDSIGSGDEQNDVKAIGSGPGKIESTAQEKKEIETEEEEKTPAPSQEEQDQHEFDTIMIRYSFRLNYYGKLGNRIAALLGDQEKADEASKLLETFYAYQQEFSRLLQVSVLSELQKLRKRVDRGFTLMAQLEEAFKKLRGSDEVVAFDQKDPATWETCTVHYASNAVSSFIARSYDAADLELRRTFQAGDRHQGGTPVTLNTPMHDHGAIDSQGISFKFVKVDAKNKEDRRVELFVYDFASRRKDNKYVWSRGDESSGPSNAK